MVPEKKLILMFLLFLVTAAILDSWPSDHNSREIRQQLPKWF